MMSGKDFMKSHIFSWRRKMYSDWEDVTSSESINVCVYVTVVCQAVHRQVPRSQSSRLLHVCGLRCCSILI